MRRSLLMRLAWRQSLLRLLAAVLALAVAIGWWTGQMAWVLLIATALGAVALALLATVPRTALPDWRQQLRTVARPGPVERRSTRLIHRGQTEMRGRKRRLVWHAARLPRRPPPRMPDGALIVVDRNSHR